ncbi:MAG: hypothetical protein JWN76_2829 [Chitinophagaceae bacterium]|nr:hypothetical protein [Chitinophagaceae bacterium]
MPCFCPNKEKYFRKLPARSIVNLLKVAVNAREDFLVPDHRPFKTGLLG